MRFFFSPLGKGEREVVVVRFQVFKRCEGIRKKFLLPNARARISLSHSLFLLRVRGRDASFRYQSILTNVIPSIFPFIVTHRRLATKSWAESPR